MAQLLGILNMQEAAAERTYINVVGQKVVYDAVQEVLARYNKELDAIKRVFVERTTEDFKFLYKLPGGGRLQRRGGLGPSGAVKAGGSWNVAVPLEDFGAMFGDSDIVRAYMTVAELDRHLETITIQDVNTYRYEILRAILNNTQRTFKDPIQGDLTIEPLANGDSVVFPPVLGSEAEATENHYLESNYASASISDTNDPIVTIVNELEEHFGAETGGSNIVVFFNNAETAKIKALAKVEDVPDKYIKLGDDTASPSSTPTTLPGKIIGRHTSGAWLSEWRYMPANYMFGQHLDAPRPLIERIDPSYTGLGQGLKLVSEDENFPFKEATYRHRFGLAVGNRLNGVVMELGTGGSYTVPTGY